MNSISWKGISLIETLVGMGLLTLLAYSTASLTIGGYRRLQASDQVTEIAMVLRHVRALSLYGACTSRCTSHEVRADADHLIVDDNIEIDAPGVSGPHSNVTFETYTGQANAGGEFEVMSQGGAKWDVQAEHGGAIKVDRF